MRKQFNDAISELDFVIENDRNFARAYALRGLMHLFVGRAADVIPEEETALRLSPRDPMRNQWEFRICHAHVHLAEWEKAVEWCQKSIATNSGFWLPYVDLVAANGWLDKQAEAQVAIAGLHKLMPGLTVQDWANIKWSDDPQFQREYARILEGLRKLGCQKEASLRRRIEWPRATSKVCVWARWPRVTISELRAVKFCATRKPFLAVRVISCSQWSPLTRRFCSLMGQVRKLPLGLDAFGCLRSLRARSALDGVSWVQGGSVEIAVGQRFGPATKSAPSSAPSLGRRSSWELDSASCRGACQA